jgi:hypothetical protein
MPDPTIQVEVAKIEGRVTTLERDTARALDSHAKSIERQEQRNDGLEADIRALQLENAVTKADLGSQGKLKWIILTAIATQVISTVAPLFHPPTPSPQEATRKR